VPLSELDLQRFTVADTSTKAARSSVKPGVTGIPFA
jgi:hypothetical protein